jgi:NADH-quinone oxidoreductase subunit A
MVNLGLKLAMQTTTSSYPYVWQYLPLVMQVLVALAVAGGMVGASFFIGKHKNSRTKGGAYECGMDPVGDARGRFSVRFYMVAMLFILFDVEAVFMLPWAVIYKQLPHITGSRLFGFWEMLVYLGFVAVGLFYVWKKGILNWSNDKGDL